MKRFIVPRNERVVETRKRKSSGPTGEVERPKREGEKAGERRKWWKARNADGEGPAAREESSTEGMSEETCVIDFPLHTYIYVQYIYIYNEHGVWLEVQNRVRRLDELGVSK